MKNVFRFNAELWLYGGESSWYFVTLPEDLSTTIKKVTTTKRGFGSVKVMVIVDHQKWLTSIFPDTKSNSYILPIKKEVRKSLNIDSGDNITVKISVIDD